MKSALNCVSILLCVCVFHYVKQIEDLRRAPLMRTTSQLNRPRLVVLEAVSGMHCIQRSERRNPAGTGRPAGGRPIVAAVIGVTRIKNCGWPKMDELSE